MKPSFIVIVFLLLLSCRLEAQPALLKEKLLHSVKEYQEQGLIDFSPASILNVNPVLSATDTSWRSSGYFQLAIRTAYSLSIGSSSEPWFVFESISTELEKSVLLRISLALEKVSTPNELQHFFDYYRFPRSAKCKSLLNLLLVKQKEYQKHSSVLLADTISWLQQAYQVYRWIDHWEFARYILVNVTAAEVQLIEGENILHSMRAIVGKPLTPTPFFAAWADRVVLYPYWFVPTSIAIQEFLPKIIKDTSWLDQQNMQVIDKAGKIVDHKILPWSQFSTTNFPYTIRQSTGCDNTLGILKLNVKTPLGVYLHDTNNKDYFSLSKRFLSHGCIRLEEPLVLGNYLLDNKLDTIYLQSCMKNQQPVYHTLNTPAPVLVIYTLVQPRVEGGVQYRKDIYQLFSKRGKG